MDGDWTQAEADHKSFMEDVEILFREFVESLQRGSVDCDRLAGSPGRAKSKFKYADPLKIFVLIYKKILINKIFHFEASYYLSQHGSHLHLTAPYSYLTDSNFWTCRSYKRM